MAVKVTILPRKELIAVKGGDIVDTCVCTAICKSTPKPSTLSKASCKKNSSVFDSFN